VVVVVAAAVVVAVEMMMMMMMMKVKKGVLLVVVWLAIDSFVEQLGRLLLSQLLSGLLSLFWMRLFAIAHCLAAGLFAALFHSHALFELW
jgi:hypothetical protein